MPNTQHALLSSSSANRWLECPPSAMLEKDLPDTVTEFALEGSAAHAVAEFKVRKYLGETDLTPPVTGHFNAAEIDRHTDTYLYYVIDRIEEIRKVCSDALVLVEQRLDYSSYVKDGFGTGDLVIVADKVIQVIDFKYGQGVPVSAEDNPQMKLYALGAISQYGYLYDIRTVRMSIVQPRLDSISEWETSVDALLYWAEHTLKPIAEFAANGKGEFKAGEHCRFCKLRGSCDARADMMLEAVKADFGFAPAVMSDDRIIEILSLSSDIQKWLSDVFAYAQAKAISGAKRWNGYKVVESTKKRRYSDAAAAANRLLKEGYPLSKLYKQTLIGLTDMKNLLGGDKRMNELIGEWIVKPKGELILVPDTDKREEVILSINDDFEEVK